MNKDDCAFEVLNENGEVIGFAFSRIEALAILQEWVDVMYQDDENAPEQISVEFDEGKWRGLI